jgi:hypothetical protein
MCMWCLYLCAVSNFLPSLPSVHHSASAVAPSSALATSAIAMYRLARMRDARQCGTISSVQALSFAPARWSAATPALTLTRRTPQRAQCTVSVQRVGAEATAHSISTSRRSFLPLSPPSCSFHSPSRLSSSPSFFADHSSLESSLGKLEQRTKALGEDKAQQNWQAVSAAYHALLLDTMSSRSPVTDVARVMRAWLQLPEFALSKERRTEMVGEVVREYFIKYSLPLSSLIGLTSSFPSLGPTPSSGNTPMASTHALKQAELPKDVWRDVVIKEGVEMNERTMKMLMVYCCIKKSPEETAAMIAILTAYRKASPPTPAAAGVALLSPTLRVDSALFQELLQIAAHHSDYTTATMLFTELGTGGGGGVAGKKLLFRELTPDIPIYKALLTCFARSNQLDAAFGVIDHFRMSFPSHSPSDLLSVFEHLISSLVRSEWIHSALVVLAKMESQVNEEGESVNVYGLEKPSERCFWELLREIPREREEVESASVPPSTAPVNPFLSMTVLERFQLVSEICTKFRQYDGRWTSPSPDSSAAPVQVEMHMQPGEQMLTQVISRIVLLGTGTEIRSALDSSDVDSSTLPVFTESHLFLHTLRLKSSTEENPFNAHPTAPVEMGLQVLQDYLVPLMSEGSTSKPSLSFLNSMLYLFGCLSSNLPALNSLVEAMQTRFGLAPNVYTMQVLMEAYGRAGLKENVAYIYAQVRAATLENHPQMSANIQTMNTALRWMDVVGGKALTDGSSTPSPPPSSSLPLLSSLLSDLSSFSLLPTLHTYSILALRLGEVQSVAPGTVVNAVRNLAYAGKGKEKKGVGILPPPPSSPPLLLTPEIASDFLALSAKLNDTKSVMEFLEAMVRVSRGSEGVTDDILPSLLPSSFSHSYLSSSSSLKLQISHRAAVQDWVGAVKLLKIWTNAGERTGVSAVEMDHFSFLRYLYSEKDLRTFLSSLVEIAMEGWTNKKGEMKVEMMEARATLIGHCFHSLLSHSKLSDAVFLLDSLSSGPVGLFPSKSLSHLLAAARAGRDATYKQQEWVQEMILRAAVGRGAWSSHVPVEEALEEVLFLLPPVEESANIGPYHVMWRLAAKVAGSALHERHAPMMNLTDRLFTALSPNASQISSFALHRRLGGNFKAEPHEVQKRVGIMMEVIQKHEVSVRAAAQRSGSTGPITFLPLISVAVATRAMQYCMRVESAETVAALYRYAIGRSISPLPSDRAQYFSPTSHTPLPPPLEHTPMRIMKAEYNSLLAFWGGKEEGEGVPVFSRQAIPSTKSRFSSSLSFPELIWEAYQQMKLHSFFPGALEIRTVVKAQAEYAGTESKVGKGQLMQIWKEIHDTLPWFESLSVLPYIVRTLLKITLSSTPSIDAQNKSALLVLLAAWAARYASTPLPKLAFHGGTSQQREAAQRREEEKLVIVRREVEQALREARQKVDEAMNQTQNTFSTSDPFDTRSSPHFIPISLTPSPALEKLRAAYSTAVRSITWPLPNDQDAALMKLLTPVLRAPPREMVDVVREGPNAAEKEAFFKGAIALMYRGKASQAFTSFMLGLTSHPLGLKACLSPSSPSRFDVPCSVLLSLLPRSGVASTQWPGFETSTIRGARAIAKDLATGQLRLVEAAQLLGSSHPAWWVNQLAYWHFKVCGLPTDAFHQDYLFTVPIPPPRQVQNMQSADTPNLFAITPKLVHAWVSKSTSLPQSVLNEFYLRSFSFLTHEVRGRQRKDAYADRIAALAGDNSSVAASLDVSLSPMQETLNTFVFELLKMQYVRSRETMGVEGMKRAPRVKRDVNELESLLAPGAISAEVAARVRAQQASQQPTNYSVYSLYYALAQIESSALDEKAWNIALASLVQFSDSGLSSFTFSAIEGMTKHMSQILNFSIAPGALSYVVEACAEQAAVERMADPTDKSGSAQHYIAFAQQLIESQRNRTNMPSFVFGVDTPPMQKPILPEPVSGVESPAEADVWIGHAATPTVSAGDACLWISNVAREAKKQQQQAQI